MRIKEDYSAEIMYIKNILDEMRRGQIYELTQVKSDGGIANKVERLEEALKDLLYRIENDLPSAIDEIYEDNK